MLGEALSILAAIMWAASTVLSAKFLEEMGPLRVNMVRSVFSAFFMIPVAVLSGDLSQLSIVSLQGLLLVMLSAIIGIGVGDTCLLKSIRSIGVSVPYIIGYTSPLFTVVMAILFLREPFLLKYSLGAVLIVMSAVLVSIKKDGEKKADLEGIALAVATSFLWAVATILLTLGLRSTSAILSSTFRLSALSLFLFVLTQPRKKINPVKIDSRSLIVLAASGIIGLALGEIAFSISIQIIGAARATPIGSSSPVWAALMSNLILKEKFTYRILLAAVLIILGVYFLV